MDLYMVRTCAWAGDMVLVISRVAYMEDEDLLAEILERYNGRGGYLNAVDEIVANGPRERPARPSLPPPPAPTPTPSLLTLCYRALSTADMASARQMLTFP
eukprot:jgi/Mesvir1/2976/Mv09602-RA.1